MDVGFTGSREYPRWDLVENFVKVLGQKYPDARVISGGSGIVDTTSENTAVRMGLEMISYRPKDNGIKVVYWKPETKWSETMILGKKNFVANCFFRNEFIAAADRVIAFWDLTSRGTADTISKARGKERELFVYGPDGGQLSPDRVSQRLEEVLG